MSYDDVAGSVDGALPMSSSVVQLHSSRDISNGSTLILPATEDLVVGRSLPSTIIVGFILVLIDVTTVLGNALVCVTIASVRRLHSVTNYLIFSLAVCDLLLGCLVLPFSVLNTLVPDSWPFGAVVCNLFVSTDVALCTVSILTLLVIAIDRYVAIVSPFLYGRLTSVRRRCAGVVALVWTFSVTMAFVPIHLGWNTLNGSVQNFADPTLCVFENSSVYYVLFVSLGTYFFPLVVLCAVYVRVYAIARRQVARIRKLTVTPCGEGRSLMICELGGAGSTTASAGGGPPPASPGGATASETKATVTLGSVVLAFAVCWIPYFVLFTWRPFVVAGFDPTLDLFTLWLGYANSMLNPFLYAFYGAEFRHGFMLVLCRKRARKYNTDSIPGDAYYL